MGIVKMMSAHYELRERDVPTAIVIYDGGAGDLNRDLFAPEARLSVHYIVQRNGEIWHCVEDWNEAFHAPEGAMLFGEQNVNSFSLGIELAEAHNDKPYTDDQIGALIGLVTALCYEYKIPLNRIVGPDYLVVTEKAEARQQFPWFDFLVVVGARISELQLSFEDAETPTS